MALKVESVLLETVAEDDPVADFVLVLEGERALADGLVLEVALELPEVVREALALRESVAVALVEDVELGETLFKRVEAADILGEGVMVINPVLTPDGKGEKVVVALWESGRLTRAEREGEADDEAALDEVFELRGLNV